MNAFLKTAALLACFAATAVAAQSQDCGDDTLCKVKAAGVLKVGTKDDYKPWSYRAPDGSFVGMEIDVANHIAEALGVKAEFVKVTSANRFEFLSQGQVDLLIASTSDTAERRKIVSFIHPNWYSSGYTVILPKAVTVTDWAQLKDQTVCATQGAWFNKPAQETFGIQILAFGGNTETEAALAQGRCVGILDDDNLINVRLADAKWAEFHKPLPVQSDTPWGMSVRQPDLKADFGYAISGILSEMHRDGSLLEMEAKNGITNSPFLIRMHDALKDHVSQ